MTLDISKLYWQWCHVLATANTYGNSYMMWRITYSYHILPL